MDIEKLIERLQRRARLRKPFIAPGEIWTGGMIRDELCADAATALSTLQAENEELRTEKIKVIGNDELMDELQAVQDENEKLRAELEQVREDNKKLCSAMMTIRRSENSERMCAEYRVDYCTALSHQETADLARIVF